MHQTINHWGCEALWLYSCASFCTLLHYCRGKHFPTLPWHKKRPWNPSVSIIGYRGRQPCGGCSFLARHRHIPHGGSLGFPSLITGLSFCPGSAREPLSVALHI